MTKELSPEPVHSDTDVTQTHLLGGRVKVMQPVKGYRIGMDGALLAAACAGLKPKGRGLELGCGAGGALLSLKARCPDLHLTGIEREPLYADLARRNVMLNEFSDINIIEGDIGHGFKHFTPPLRSGGLASAKVQLSPAMGEQAKTARSEGASMTEGASSTRYDLVFTNPPFYDDPDALRPPHDAKRPAWIADDGLAAWIDFALSAVKDNGDIVFIHRADRLADLLGGLSSKAGSFVIRPFQPFADKDAKRVIVRAKRLGKAPLRLLPPLVLHDDGVRKHTPEVEAILLGQQILGW